MPGCARAKVRSTLARKKVEARAGSRASTSGFLSRAGYGIGSGPPGVGPSKGGTGVCQGEERCRPSFTSIVCFVLPR